MKRSTFGIALTAGGACLALATTAFAGTCQSSRAARAPAAPAPHSERLAYAAPAAPQSRTTARPQSDIVATAVAADGFKTLVAAVKAGGLVETLQGKGPFTVFAPTDEAFAKLPKETLANLLKPQNKDQLVAILKYHVVPGRVMAKDVVKLDSAKTANGESLTITAEDGKVMVDSAGVVKTDIACSNGVIHVIDSVLLPADIVETAAAADQFKTLVAAVKAAGLVETLQGQGPFTVFAPTDEAFAKLPQGTIANLLKPENKEQLVSILTYHVVPGRVLAQDVVELDSAKTVNGASVEINADGGTVMVNSARVIKTDVLCGNGVIHVIDAVLLPE
jgi:transforming growth factor-beta-induced protein